MIDPITTIAAVFSIVHGVYKLGRKIFRKRKETVPYVGREIRHAEERLGRRIEDALGETARQQQWLTRYVGSNAPRDCMPPSSHY
jgi:hypothetical protein